MGVASAAALLTGVICLFIGAESLDLGAALGDMASVDASILWHHRFPRVLQGLVAGAVLASAGAALQGLLRNALAEPFLLGVSGGAAVGSALVALVGLGGMLAEPVGGFLGSLGALILVTVLSTRRGVVSPLHMLLVGVVINALSGAGLMLLQTLASAEAVQRVLLRLMGTLTVDPSQPLVMPILLGAAGVGLWLVLRDARALDLLALGDDAAATMGVDPDGVRRRLFLALSLPIGAVVAATGLIGFVGLIVPHAVRLVIGPDHRLLIPLSAACGATFVIVADAVARGLSDPLGTELPVGVLTTLVGGPLFLVLLRREVRG